MATNAQVLAESTAAATKAAASIGGTFQQAVGYTPGKTSPNPAPTTGGTVARYPSNINAPKGQSADTAESDYVASTTPETYDQIEARILSSYQPQLAAMKSIYAGLVSDQTKANTEGEARTRASTAATGTLGSDFGDTQQTKKEEESQKNLQDLANTEMSKEGAITSEAATAAEAEFTGNKTANTAALANNVAYRQQAIKDTQAKIATVAASIKLDDLPQDEYDSLFANSGLDNPEEFNAFYEASRTAAQAGTKLVGDATTGFYMPYTDTSGNLAYKNVIKPIVKPTQYGAYQFDPTTGEVKTIAPSQPKIVSSGGRIWSIDPTTNKAVPLTASSGTGGGKVGWQRATIDQQLAVQSVIEAQAIKDGKDPKPYLAAVQSNPDAFLTALNGALQAGIYVPAAVSSDTGGDTSATDEAVQAATDAEDAANNANLNDPNATDTGS